ncbi:MAG: glycosyltransferase family 39 protein, partial [Candidatus Atribacteria bacterium]|nr:glycosyltransferase family 39 protein [Candidatus Atribacteria bacterium]
MGTRVLIKKLWQTKLGFILILLIGLSVRITSFGSIPPGLNQDEASIGYDAWALMRYGIDRNGFHNPVHFVSWGSGQNALYAYFSMPFIAWFGLNTVSVRMINLCFGILSLLVFFVLIKKSDDEKTSLLSLLLLAISPWHIMISRWGLESNIFPSMILFALYFLMISREKKNLVYFSSILFALSLYSYGPSYIIVPLLLILISLVFLVRKKITVDRFLGSLGVFLILALPMMLFIMINFWKLSSVQTAWFSIPRLAESRLKELAFFQPGVLQSISANFFTFFRILIYPQDDGLIWNAIPGYG